MSDTKQYSLDQTAFSVEEPLYEGSHSPVKKSSKLTSPVKKPNRWVFLALASTGMCIIVLGIAMLTTRQDAPVTQATPQPTVVPDTPELSRLEELLNEVEKDIENADPTDADLPFPPVETQIFISPPTR